MNRICFCLLIILSSSTSRSCYAQTCDTLEIKQILKEQMRLFDKRFDRDFVLMSSSKPYNPKKSIYSFDSTYSNYPCDSVINWSEFNITSKYGVIQSDTTTDFEYSCFISTPVFNAKMTRCRVVTALSFSEWGGSSGYSFYKKRWGRWKLIRTRLISVS